MDVKLIDHTNGLVGAAGDGTTLATARAFGTGLTLAAGDEAKALANVPVDTGLTAELEYRRDKIRVASQAFWRPVAMHTLARRTATWTRSGTTFTATTTIAHGLSDDDWIYFPPDGTSSLLAMPVLIGGASVFMVQVTVTGANTFTFTAANAGDTAGWLEYTCKLCEPDRYFTWTRSGTTITCTTYNAHGQGAGASNVNVIINSHILAIVQTTIKAATFSSTNTFTFTGANSGATSGAGFYEHGWNVAANITSTVAVTSGIMRNDGCRNYMTYAAGFTTGLSGSIRLKAATDLSAWQMLSMHFYANLVITGTRLVLCSDNAGATPITGCDWKLYNGTPVVNARAFALTLTPYGVATIWTASEAVNVGDKRYNPQHIGNNSGVYRCTGAGNCGTVEPKFMRDGSTITDGDATWVFDGFINLPTNVLSIAIYHDTDPVLMILGIDEIYTFHAPTSADSLTLETLLCVPPEIPIARNTLYSVDNIRVPSFAFGSNMRYICTTGGTSHADTEPTWNHVIGSLTTDGETVWKNIGYQDVPYLIRGMHFLDDTKTDVTLHDAGPAVGYQGSTVLNYWSLGYINPLFPSVLTAQAEIGDDHIHLEDSAGYVVGETIKISLTEEYTISSNDTTTNVLGISPSITAQRVAGSVVRLNKKTVSLYKITPHYNGKFLGTLASTAVDALLDNGIPSNPAIYKGGYDPTFTNIIGRTYIYGFNHTTYKGYGTVSRAVLEIHNIYYCGFLIGIAARTIVSVVTPGEFIKTRNCGALACQQIGIGSLQIVPADNIIPEYCTAANMCPSTEPYGMFAFGTTTLRGKALFVCGSRLQATAFANGMINGNAGAQVSNTTINYYNGENFIDGLCALVATGSANPAVNADRSSLFVRNLKSDGVEAGAFSGAGFLARVRNLIDRTNSGGIFINPAYHAQAMSYAPWIMSENHQGVAGAIRWEQFGAVVLRDSSIEGYSWRGYITSTAFVSALPCRLPVLFTIRVVQGVECSFKVKLRRDSTNITCGVIVPAAFNDLTGDDIVVPITGDANTDQEITVTFTPSRSGVIEPRIYAYSTDAVSSFYVGEATDIGTGA